MSILIPMAAPTFDQYLKQAITGYAEQSIASGRWSREGALARSRAEHDKLLPQGLATPDNFLFEITDIESRASVGSIWFGIVERGGVRSAYVFDVRVNLACRRQGYAKRAFKALEPLVRALGLNSIGLHVFAFNAGAQNLYAALGYEVTGINMIKHLADDGAMPAGRQTNWSNDGQA